MKNTSKFTQFGQTCYDIAINAMCSSFNIIYIHLFKQNNSNLIFVCWYYHYFWGEDTNILCGCQVLGLGQRFLPLERNDTW